MNGDAVRLFIVKVRSLISDAVNKYTIEIGRMVVMIGIWIRFWFNRFQYNEATLAFLLQSTLAIFTLYSVLTLLASMRFSSLWKSDRWITFQNAFDISIFTLLMLLSGNAESDLFLLYFLPILLATDRLTQFPRSKTAVLFGIVTVLFVAVVGYLPASFPADEKLVRVVLPRITFFFLVLWLSVSKIRQLADAAHNLSISNTRLQQQTDSLERLANELKVLRQADIEIVESELVESSNELLFLDTIVERCKWVFGVTSVHLRLVEGQYLVLRSGTGGYTSLLQQKVMITLTRNQPYISPFLKAHLDSCHVIVEEALSDESFLRVFEQAKLTQNVLAVSELKGIKGYGCFPIVYGNTKLGVLTVALGHNDYFSTDLVQRIKDFTRRVGVTIYQHKLVEQLKAIQDFTVGVVAQKTQEDLLMSLADAARTFLEASGSLIYQLSPDGQYLSVEAAIGISTLETNKHLYHLSISEGIAGEVFRTRTPYIENDYSKSKYRVERIGDIFDNSAVIEFPLMGSAINQDREVIGILVVVANHETGRTFSTADFSILARLAELASLAIHTDRLITRQRTLQDVAIKLTSNLKIEHVLEALFVGLKTLTYYDFATVQLLNGSQLKVIACAGFDEIGRQEVLNLTFDGDDNERPNQEVIRTKAPRMHLDVSQSFSKFRKSPFGKEIKTWLGVPLIAQDRVIGMLAVDRKIAFPFSNDEISLVQTFANYAAVAIQNAELFKNTESLRRISLRISMVDDPGKIGDAILDGLSQIIQFHKATLQLIEGDKRTIIASRGIATDQFVAPKSLQEDELVKSIVESNTITVLSHTDKNELWDTDIKQTEDVKSWLGMPLTLGDSVIGFVTLDHREPGYYTESDAALLELVQGQAAIAVANAKLVKSLRNQVRHLEDVEGLAMIGLLYGEDMHFLAHKLGTARDAAKIIEKNTVNDSIEKQKITIMREKANLIRRNVSEVLDLVRKLRETVSPSDPEEIDIKGLIQEKIDAVGLSNDIAREWDIGNSCRTIWGFRTQLGQVFRVIIHNASRAMPSGVGNLTISCQQIVIDKRVYLQVSISDTGKGMAPEEIPYVFRIGNRASQGNTSGLGVGLAWSRLFLRWYKGDLNLKVNQYGGITAEVLVLKDVRDLTRIYTIG